jgi:hypothetical protein
MRTRDSNEVADRGDAESLALQALVWILSEQDRAERLLAMTGLDPDDLIACADSLGIKPEALVRARAQIDGPEFDA